ncbi:hypothetical protein SAMN05421823_107227 [Catalinimonas alkaloidigena]|uniref:Uncharacterized protein n=1 Tax=Catalinimonas alkaloidigena TaxID=1075417 RepID=A0A1G9M0N1_9BACT|nr:hypothetical protein [Catalinimonas alkaloidigena]SDL67799.1 hypothetical protein SAMN05421823_107227 [Catalinimonas alkaloidigena]
MKIRLTYGLGLALLLSGGCVERPESTLAGEAPRFFDVKGFVDTQVALLQQKQPALTKRVFIDGERQEKQLQKVDWSRELAQFRDADLNKPAWRDSYTIDTVATDAGRTVVYTALDQDLPVDKLQVTMEPNTGEVLGLRADLRSHNLLYDSRRQLMLECQPQAQEAVQVTHYRLKGYQKLVLRDSVRFDVEVQVVP